MAHRLPPHVAEMRPLLQDGPDGYAPGIDLDTLFAELLRAAYLRGTLTLEQAYAAIIVPLGHLSVRMQTLYQGGPESGMRACLRAALAQCVSRGLLREKDGAWHKTERLVADKRLEVLGNGKAALVAITLAPEDSPEMLEAARARMRVHEVDQKTVLLAQRLYPGRGGLRPVDPLVVQAIVDRYREQGFIDKEAFYILRDQYGRVLSGHHRLAAAEILGIAWPAIEVHVAGDAEAVAIALESNMGAPWALEKVKDPDGKWHAVPVPLRDHQDVALGTRAKQARVRKELLNDASWSDRVIGERIGVDHMTVGKIRRAMEKTGEIRQFIFKGGRGCRRGVLADAVVFKPNTQHALVYAYLLRYGPCTDQMLQDAFRGRYDERGISARRRELVQHGWAREVEGGAKARSGQRVAVWEAVPQDSWAGLPPEAGALPRPPSQQTAAGGQQRPTGADAGAGSVKAPANGKSSPARSTPSPEHNTERSYVQSARAPTERAEHHDVTQPPRQEETVSRGIPRAGGRAIEATEITALARTLRDATERTRTILEGVEGTATSRHVEALEELRQALLPFSQLYTDVAWLHRTLKESVHAPGAPRG